MKTLVQRTALVLNGLLLVVLALPFAGLGAPDNLRPLMLLAPPVSALIAHFGRYQVMKAAIAFIANALAVVIYGVLFVAALTGIGGFILLAPVLGTAAVIAGLNVYLVTRRLVNNRV